MKKHQIAESLERAADALTSVALAADKSPAAPVTAGIVLASGFARLLQRLKASEPYHGKPDVGPDSDGMPTRKEPEAGEPTQLKIDQLKPFGVLSAYRKQYSKKANMQRSAKLLRNINTVLGKPGAYKLIGYWAEKDPAAEDLPYKEALDQGLIQEPSQEESFLIVKPDEMEYEEFEKAIARLGRATGDDAAAPQGDPRKEAQQPDDGDTQDGVIVCDGEAVYILEPRSGAKFKIGTGLAASVIAKAYSRMKNKPNIPFVFAGTQHPMDMRGMQLMTMVGLRWLTGKSDDDSYRAAYKASTTYAKFMGV